MVALSTTRDAVSTTIGSAASRTVLLFIVALATAGGLLATDSAAASQAVAAAGDDLVCLLRMMAALKAGMAAAVALAVFWRLGRDVQPVRLAGYAAGCALMAAGPGLIWAMAHVGLGALLLHAGLLFTIVLLWFDPAVGGLISERILARRRI